MQLYYWCVSYYVAIVPNRFQTRSEEKLFSNSVYIFINIFQPNDHEYIPVSTSTL